MSADVCPLTPPSNWTSDHPSLLAVRAGAPLRNIAATFTPWPIAVNFGSGPIRPVGLILHVQAGNGGLYGWFSNPGAQVSAHLWAGKGGEREQYVDLEDIAWAQAGGNRLYVSIETEGIPSEPLNEPQLDSVAAAMAEGCRRWGWPLTLADSPGTPGLGWHGMGGAAYGGHPGCPGDIRRGQRTEILRRAAAILTPPPEDDVTPDDISAIAAAVWKTGPPAISPTVRQPDQAHVAVSTYNKAGDIQARLARMETAMAHWSTGSNKAAAEVLARPLEPTVPAPDELLAAVGAVTDRELLVRLMQVVAHQLGAGVGS